MAEQARQADPVDTAEVAEVLRCHSDEIVGTVLDRYRAYYAHSENADVSDDLAWAWTSREIGDFLDCIERGGVGNRNHAAWVGDAVRPHFELFSPLFNRLEMVMLYAESCSGVLWESFMGDAARLNQAMSVFEGCVLNLLSSDMRSFAEDNLNPGSLVQTWRLGPHRQMGKPDAEQPNADAAARQGAQALSRRQLQIVRFVAEGRSNGEIAAELGLSANTVRNHIAAIFDKLNVNNRTELALYAMREGLL